MLPPNSSRLTAPSRQVRQDVTVLHPQLDSQRALTNAGIYLLSAFFFLIILFFSYLLCFSLIFVIFADAAALDQPNVVQACECKVGKVGINESTNFVCYIFQSYECVEE